MNRSRYWGIMLPFWLVFWLLFVAFDNAFGIVATNVLFVVFLIPSFFLSAKRLHDTDKSAWWMPLVTIPVIGPVWLFLELGLRRGTQGDNRYGEDPLKAHYDYLSLP